MFLVNEPVRLGDEQVLPPQALARLSSRAEFSLRARGFRVGGPANVSDPQPPVWQLEQEVGRATGQLWSRMHVERKDADIQDLGAEVEDAQYLAVQHRAVAHLPAAEAIEPGQVRLTLIAFNAAHGREFREGHPSRVR